MTSYRGRFVVARCLLGGGVLFWMLLLASSAWAASAEKEWVSGGTGVAGGKAPAPQDA